jgi:hypothetical protein
MRTILKNVSMLFIPFLLFQSYGGGILRYNMKMKHPFTEGWMNFWKPEFIFQAWTNIFYPIYAIAFTILVFAFIRRVKINSWQFVFVIIVSITFSLIANLSAIIKFRDMIIPVMLLVVFEEKQ